MKCRMCGKESQFHVCEACVRINNDPRVLKIWEDNKKFANSLGEAYYESVLKSYKKNQIERGGRENLGFNAFCDGINLGLDVVMPFLAAEKLEEARDRMAQMIELRKKSESSGM